ncbi:DNRLRE domain-containing protein [Xylanimonas protaetiae]|uniref:DNRLRE domain-containing protein n=1 Tax=Xylanimonas protaetiae TaxID=2509457 RepID=A0A4V0YFT1_9MICO|nr:DNRLRE domain-containing protein [Xylanimonas protaetiae]QAY68791.1 DNRLRE domain-containing protein [Xylanimonas protaetiae]
MTAVLAVCAVGALGASPAVAEETDASASVPCADAAPTIEEAGALAGACGTDVVVSGLTDPWSKTTVLADGLVQWSTTVEAERSLTADGQWVPVDTSFRAPQDGRIGLAAPAVAMSFSDGTPGQPLAVAAKDGHELTYDMPFDLPAPVVDADAGQLTYAGVLDGVDLIVTVASDGSGFSEVLRVESAEALAQPGLADLVIPVDLSEGLSWDQGANGDLDAVDESGDVVFTAPAPTAWDSSADTLPSATAPVQGLSPALAPLSAPLAAEMLADEGIVGADPSDLGELEPADRDAAPVDGDTVAPLEVTIGGDGEDLALGIDEGLVDDAVFPLYIDPSVSGSVTGRAYVQSGWPTTAHWNDVTNYGVGRCDPNLGCSGVNIYRSYFQFSAAGLNAAQSADIQSATLTLYGQHSYSCTATPVNIWHTGGISSGTTWNAQPSHISVQASASLAHKAACSNARDVSFSVLGAAQYSADANSDQITLGVFAADEGTITGWKRYENPRLSVTWNRLPNAPSAYSMTSPSGKACGTSASPALINDSTPSFSWTVSDPDGGKVIRNFDLINPAGTNVNNLAEDTQGNTFTHTVPAGVLVTNTKYNWKVGGRDVAARAAGVYGPMASCWFTYDGTAPANPSVTSAKFSQTLVVPMPAAADRTFTVTDTATDVAGYKFVFDADDPSGKTASAADANQDLKITLPSTITSGSHRLVVMAVDKAGNVSGKTTFRFAIAAPPVAAYWTMDAAAATIPDWSPSAPDRAGETPMKDTTVQNLVFAASPARTTGVYQSWGLAGTTDQALNLVAGAASGVAKDSNGFVAPVIERPGDGFTVTAWVKPSTLTPATDGVVVSLDGTKTSAFTLGLVKGGTGCATVCWAFTKTTADTDAAATGVTRAVSPIPVTNTWVLIAARYTPATSTMEIVVCDPNSTDRTCRPEQLADSIKPTTGVPVPTWASYGAMRVGQGIVKNSAGAYVPGNGFVGAVDDVRVYKAPVKDEQIIRIAQLSDQGA